MLSFSSMAFAAECEDITGDNRVDIFDLVNIVKHWGGQDPKSDVDNSGTVGIEDLILISTFFGDCPEIIIPQCTIDAAITETCICNGGEETFGYCCDFGHSSGVCIASGEPPNPDIYYPDVLMVAPLTLLFSGIESSAAGGAEVVEYAWDFGDSGSADSQTDEGMLVAHRFDNDGTYTVTLTVTDSIGLSASTSTQITVDAFSGPVYYVANSGNDSNPGTEAEPFQTLSGARSQIIAAGPSLQKLLLKRGDSWSIADSDKFNLPHGTFMGAYGTGAKPIIEIGLNAIVRSQNPSDKTDTIRIEDIHFRHAVQHGTKAYINAYVPGAVIRRVTIENGGIAGTLQDYGLLLLLFL